MKTHCFSPANPFPVPGFRNAFNIACDGNRIFKSAAMWAMPRFVTDRAASLLNSRKSWNDNSKSITFTVESSGAARQTFRLWSYPKVVNHLLKRKAHNNTIAETSAAIVRFTNRKIWHRYNMAKHSSPKIYSSNKSSTKTRWMARTLKKTRNWYAIIFIGNGLRTSK